uniref:Uncharacterized protein n=1 Tax=Meloidogyne enterolobii TaxID=390850 RepID=A0A6V7X804_MELEN|nr:unnamed protein product [Meloidogyne enterolobii]
MPKIRMFYSKAGCGTCDEKKIEKSCVDCKELKCNSKELLAKTIFCYEKVKNGKTNEGKRPCLVKKCFISYDTKIVEQGCGDSPKEVKDIQYAVCDKPLCNTKELFDKTLFCFIKDSQKEKYKKAIKQCDKECFVLEMRMDICGKAVTVAWGKIPRIVMPAKLIIATRKNMFINSVWMEYTIILIRNQA